MAFSMDLSADHPAIPSAPATAPSFLNMFSSAALTDEQMEPKLTEIPQINENNQNNAGGGSKNAPEPQQTKDYSTAEQVVADFPAYSVDPDEQFIILQLPSNVGLNSESLQQLQLANLHSPQPQLVFGNTQFSGVYESQVGTALFFSSDRQNLNYLGKTFKRIHFQSQNEPK
jgi:hypothetical protein